MSHSQWFLVESCGICRWTIRHQVTGEPAGAIARTPAGYVLTDDEGLRIGSFLTLDHAVERLYDFV
ncbi:hypothetical protein ACVXZ4_05870 [Lacisediminihabitans sp. FW035]